MKACRWEVVHTGPAAWHARFVAVNGNIIVSSESYKRRRDAVRAIEVVVKPHLEGLVEVRDVDAR